MTYHQMTYHRMTYLATTYRLMSYGLRLSSVALSMAGTPQLWCGDCLHSICADGQNGTNKEYECELFVDGGELTIRDALAAGDCAIGSYAAESCTAGIKQWLRFLL
jgi:hypothetical protein